MVRLARPGGWVVGLEPDVEISICYPPIPELARLFELFAGAFARNGADPNIGRRMAELDALDAAARPHFEHPEPVVMPHLSFIAWGRKPG